MCSPRGFLLEVTLYGAWLGIPSGTRKRLLTALLGFELGLLGFVEPSSSSKPEKWDKTRTSIWLGLWASATVK